MRRPSQPGRAASEPIAQRFEFRQQCCFLVTLRSAAQHSASSGNLASSSRNVGKFASAAEHPSMTCDLLEAFFTMLARTLFNTSPSTSQKSSKMFKFRQLLLGCIKTKLATKGSFSSNVKNVKPLHSCSRAISRIPQCFAFLSKWSERLIVFVQMNRNVADL